MLRGLTSASEFTRIDDGPMFDDPRDDADLESGKGRARGTDAGTGPNHGFAMVELMDVGRLASADDDLAPVAKLEGWGHDRKDGGDNAVVRVQRAASGETVDSWANGSSLHPSEIGVAHSGEEMNGRSF